MNASRFLKIPPPPPQPEMSPDEPLVAHVEVAKDCAAKNMTLERFGFRISGSGLQGSGLTVGSRTLGIMALRLWDFSRGSKL